MSIEDEIKELRKEIAQLKELILNPPPKPKVFKIRTVADIMAIPQYTMAGYKIE